MKTTGIILFALVSSFLPATRAAHATTLVAGVSITTPAESLFAHSPPRNPSAISPDASPARGTALSVGATVVPIAVGAALIGADVERNVLGTSLLVGGLVVGPSIGYLDAGLFGRGARGIGLRAAGAALAFSATISAIDESNDSYGPIYLFLGGCAITTGLAIYDCAAVHGDIAKAKRARVSVVPVTVGRAPGVGLTVRF